MCASRRITSDTEFYDTHYQDGAYLATHVQHLGRWHGHQEGPMSHQVAMRAIDLMGQEVIPALKAYQADREKGRASSVGKGHASQ